jgi:hypothetical protein
VTVTASALEVLDDGRGALRPGEPSAAAAAATGGIPGRGLAGLRDRVGALGGRLLTDSPPGGGFRLRVELADGSGEAGADAGACATARPTPRSAGGPVQADEVPASVGGGGSRR